MDPMAGAHEEFSKSPTKEVVKEYDINSLIKKIAKIEISLLIID